MEKQEYIKCLRCNRVLKTAQAKKRGYGNHCWHLHQLEIEKNKKTMIDLVLEQIS